MRDWRTSLCGIVFALAGYVLGHPVDFAPWIIRAANILSVLAPALGLFFAKDAVAHKESGPDDRGL